MKISVKQINVFYVILIVTTGLALRVYGSLSIPINYDEKELLEFVNKIHISNNDSFISLPITDKITRNPPILPYLIKFSHMFLGASIFSTRLPSILFGTLSLILCYFLVRDNISRESALLSVLLLSLCPFSIGFTRAAEADGLILFFVICVLFFIQKALLTNKRKHLFLGAFFIGLGLLVKLSFVTILPGIVFFVFIHRINQNKFSKADFFYFMVIITLMLSPIIIWNVQNEFYILDYNVKKADIFSISLVPAALFLGELMVMALNNFDDSMLELITSMERPFMNWLMGVLCLSGVFYFLKRKENQFVNLLKWVFISIFIILSFIRPRTGGGYYFHLDNFWWASVLVVPGIILASAMLVELKQKFKNANMAIGCMIIYFLLNAVQFVNYPANCFLPRKSLRLRELKFTVQNYLNEGNEKKAEDVSEYIRKYYY